MPVHVSSTCAYLQEVKIVLYSLWHHHTIARNMKEWNFHKHCSVICF